MGFVLGRIGIVVLLGLSFVLSSPWSGIAFALAVLATVEILWRGPPAPVASDLRERETD